MTEAHPHIVIACFAATATADTSRAVLAALGLPPGPGPRWRGFGRRLVAAWPAELSDAATAAVRALAGVERVIHLTGDDRLYAHWPLGHATPSPFGRRAGAAEPLVIAGPCSLEDEEQLMETARVVAAAGAHALRCGLFKPRTSPYSFGGLGEGGLELLVRARAQTGLPVVTEVLDGAQLEFAAGSVDLVQVGSRNMHNSSLLFRAGAHPAGRPVLLKRGFGATVEEFLHAAEYVLLGRLAAGHAEPGLLLCERGIRSFDHTTRFTLDVGAIAALRRLTHLPVVVDPSHAAGDRELVIPLARAALAAGADGLLVEVHPDPPGAWCDGVHGLDPASFGRLMDHVRTVRVANARER